MIGTDPTARPSLRVPQSQSKFATSKPRRKPVIDRWLTCINKWINLLEKWETEGNLIRKLYQFSTTGRNNRMEDTLLSDELDSILKDEIKPLRFSLFDFSSDLQRIELYPKAAKQKVEVLRIKLHRIGEKYDEVKHKMLLNITELYPISII